MYRRAGYSGPWRVLVTAGIMLGLGIADAQSGSEPSPSKLKAMQYVVVTPDGPRDGGDFGPFTPDTKTSGLQEAFNYAKANRRDVYIAGGTVPGPFKNGVVYHLQETLRIPWFQDFRLDGGEYVINYDNSHGDAIVIDSQMSCRFKFGLIVSPSDGVGVRLKPETKGPDDFAVITASTFEFNAIVGAGSVFPDGKKQPVGTGLHLDASSGPILYNKIYATEIIACATGVLLTCEPEGRPSTGITSNSFDIPFLHLCGTHLQAGDARANVSRNTFNVSIDGNDLESSTGVRMFGKVNLLNLDVVRTAPGKALVFEGPSTDNRVTAMELSSGMTNNATRPTNIVVPLRPSGFGIETPPVQASSEACVNRTSCSVDVLITAVGNVTEWTLLDADGGATSFQAPLYVGQAIRLDPGEAVRLTYYVAPTWRWHAIRG